MPPTPTLTPELGLTWFGCAGLGLDASCELGWTELGWWGWACCALPRGSNKEAEHRRYQCCLSVRSIERATSRNNTSEMVEKAKQHCYLRFQAPVLNRIAAKRLQQRGGTSQILALFAFSKHRTRNKSQQHQRDGRKSETALVSGALCLLRAARDKKWLGQCLAPGLAPGLRDPPEP